MRGIYRRGNVYWGRWSVGGKEHRESLSTTDEAQASARYEARKIELASHGGRAATWKEAMVNWAELVYTAQHDEDGLSEGTRETYREVLRPVSYLWADKRLSEIGAKEIGEWVRLRKRGFTWYEEVEQAGGTVQRERRDWNPCTNATARRSLTAISSVFRAAQAVGLVDSNPVKTWDKGVIPERNRHFIPPLPEEIETFLRYCSARQRRLFEFAANTGMRKSEVTQLTWRDVRREHGDVLLPKTKRRRPRAVPLATIAGDAARTLDRTPRHPTAQWVFWHSEGLPYRDLSQCFRAVMERVVREEKLAGRPFHVFRLHDLRHAFAVRWLLAGGDIYALSKHLGHSTVKTTEQFYLCMISDYESRARPPEPHSDPHSLSSSTVVPMVRPVRKASGEAAERLSAWPGKNR